MPGLAPRQMMISPQRRRDKVSRCLSALHGLCGDSPRTRSSRKFIPRSNSPTPTALTREAHTLEAMIGMSSTISSGAQGRCALCRAAPSCSHYARPGGWRSARSRSARPPAPNAPYTATNPPAGNFTAVMRYAGPRMMLRHPRLAFYHLVIDGRREKPGRAVRKGEAA